MSKTKKILIVFLFAVAFALIFSGKSQAAVDSSKVTREVKTITFDAEYYLSSYADLRTAFGTDEEAAYNHYLTFGIKEGRVANLLFDVKYYVSSYNDLTAAFGTDYEAAYNHFINFGLSEGRTGCQIYNAKYYLANNSDVAACYGSTNYTSAYFHYAYFGISEGRVACDSFNVRCYLRKYSDLTRAFTATGYKEGFVHYLTFGIKEGRVGTHEYTEITVVEPTCTEAGYTINECKCGLASTTTDITAATGHSTYISKEAQDPTCTEDGWTAEETCSVCHEVVTASETIPATGHSYATYTVTAATCTTAGRVVYECETCGYAYTETVNALGHSYSLDKTVSGADTNGFVWTPTGDGYTAQVTFACSRCSNSTETVDATVEVTATTEATCEDAGSKTYTATVTYEDETYTSTLTVATDAALGHTYVQYKSDANYEYMICTTCGGQTTVEHSFTETTFTLASDSEVVIDDYDFSSVTGLTDTTEFTHVCKNDGCGYKGTITFAEIVASAPSGTTIKVGTLTVEKELTIPDGVSVIDTAILVKPKAILTVDAGTGTITTSNSISVSGGNIYFKSGTLSAPNGYGIGLYYGAKAYVSGGTISSKYAAVSGNNTQGTFDITITGGTLTAAQGPAIYMPNQFTLTMSDGTINGGISIRMGTVKISGGTINSITYANEGTIDALSDLYKGTYIYKYGGNVFIADALYVMGGTYYGYDYEYDENGYYIEGSKYVIDNDLDLTVTGGTFNCLNTKGSAVAIYDLGHVEQSMTVSITGGTFNNYTGSEASEAYRVVPFSYVGIADSEYGKADLIGKVSTTITGGTFNCTSVTTLSSYVPVTEYKVTTVTEGESYKVEEVTE